MLVSAPCSSYIAIMKITGQLTDDAVLAELGSRIAGRRLDMELTQADLAEQAGIAKRTLERIEAGQTSQLTTLIRVLRVLDATAGLDGLIPEAGPSPMDLLKHKGKVRQRASGRRRAKASDKPWRWDEKP
jgi:transcriptional regulator with XRE-family HTH domain